MKEGDGILLNDWKVDLMERFLLTIQEKRVFVDLEDRMRWKETKSVEFSIKSLYGALGTRNATPFPWNIIWNPCIVNVTIYNLGIRLAIHIQKD